MGALCGGGGGCTKQSKIKRQLPKCFHKDGSEAGSQPTPPDRIYLSKPVRTRGQRQHEGLYYCTYFVPLFKAEKKYRGGGGIALRQYLPLQLDYEMVPLQNVQIYEIVSNINNW